SASGRQPGPHRSGLVWVLSLPLQHLPPNRGRFIATLRGGRRRRWFLQLFVNVDGVGALCVEHDIERLHAVLLPGEVRCRWTIAKQGWGRSFPLLLGPFSQLAQSLDARLDGNGEPRTIATQFLGKEQLPRSRQQSHLLPIGIGT